MKIERRGYTRPFHVGNDRSNAQAGLAPESVLGFFHIPEEPAEVHDAGRVVVGSTDGRLYCFG